ncbi:hypothetical protein DYBT9623_05218 [Dyadobacter sp. CECT 9623]|uniref:DUF5672 domain-containing protein n=1 Tax=Dyadobacter linearis TaxID=2823330 RepID=A0ABM8UY62_9BACT|nr:DUF5672 family protein [Dyadobacter sp. CECT 9623]CAG5074531.1 hypothetical protein DYBT9623_05218 [Dyadobacter sp. CECT 9623]
MQNRPINNTQVVIVIPVYKNQLCYNEHFSLIQCRQILANYQLIAIAPDDLDMSDFPSVEVFDQVKRFDPAYFKDIQGYNKLMLSTSFYQSLVEYEFILIHQLDALVFKDELLYWCNSGYDYIGAPWPRPALPTDLIKAIKIPTFFHIRQNKMKDGVPSDRQFDNMVGNGGLSLEGIVNSWISPVSLPKQ